MTEPPSAVSTNSSKDRALPLLLVFFVGSGCAALIYEIVWFQLLQLVIGSSAVSLGVLLGTFMGGMCLGSLALPRVIGVHRHPLRVYAILELAIGALGIAILFALPYVDALYATSVQQGWTGVLPRAAIAAVLLLPPTLLMGATLPAVARWVQATSGGVSWLGFFYGSNIAGAVVGCLLAGFYLLRVYDMTTATYVAAFINAAVGLLGLALAHVKPHRAQSKLAESHAAPRKHPWAVYVAICLSGMAALGAEVIWTRLLSLMIGGTVYTFSIILAVFLAGLGVGSSAGAVIGRRCNPNLALGACQLLLAAAIWWAAHQLATSLPYWPIDYALSINVWHSFQLDVLRCLWAIFPAAVLWGASFPLALAAAADGQGDAGRLVGRVYAANTLGAILGAAGFSTFIVAWIGTERGQQLLIAIAATAALFAILPLVGLKLRAPSGEPQTSRVSMALRLAGLLVAGITVGCIALGVPATPGELIAHGRYLPTRSFQDEIVYQGEGVNASVAVTLRDGFIRSFHVSGKVEASSWAQDMRLQRLLGHVPALVHPKPKSVLVVGCGAGVTAGSFVVHPDVKRIVICEIEPLIPEVVAKYFAEENYDVVNDKRVEIVYDDARHFVLTTNETFDVITSDPIHPWVKGAATLYTKEYFELCKKRLNPGGVISQWVPLYESNSEAVKSEIATFFEVFPEGTVWSNDDDGAGYDVVLLGQADPLQIDIAQLSKRVEREDHAAVADSLVEVGFDTLIDVLATYAGSAADLKPWLADAEINRDRNLRLQYIAGWGSGHYDETRIYDDMLRYRKYPEKLFVASLETGRELKRKLGLIPGEP
jgi:spermidine synthase